jgi:hypothetical protein
MVQVFIRPTNSFTFSNAFFMVGTPKMAQCFTTWKQSWLLREAHGNKN